MVHNSNLKVMISGKNGIARVAADVLAAHRVKTLSPGNDENKTVNNDFFCLPQIELKEAIFSQLVDKQDEELTRLFTNFEGAERSAYVIPKAASLLVAMEVLGIQRLHWRPAIGSCAGILVDGGEW